MSQKSHHYLSSKIIFPFLRQKHALHLSSIEANLYEIRVDHKQVINRDEVIDHLLLYVTNKCLGFIMDHQVEFLPIDKLSWNDTTHNILHLWK